MKIVIDISEEDYSETMYKSEYSPSEMDWADRIISDGTPLEKVLEDIKAEIRKCNVADFIAVQSVLEIIDKHISGEEKI